MDAAAQVDSRRQIERAFGRDGFDGEAALLELGEPAVKEPQTLAEPPVHVETERPESLRVVQEPRGRHLLGLGRPGADVSQQVRHALRHRRGGHRPADPQSRRGQRLGDRIEHDHVGRRLRYQSRRRERVRASEVQGPIDLIEHQECGPLAARRARHVFLHQIAADLGQHARIDPGAGGIQRRIEGEQSHPG